MVFAELQWLFRSRTSAFILETADTRAIKMIGRLTVGPLELLIGPAASSKYTFTYSIPQFISGGTMNQKPGAFKAPPGVLRLVEFKYLHGITLVNHETRALLSHIYWLEQQVAESHRELTSPNGEKEISK